MDPQSSCAACSATAEALKRRGCPLLTAKCGHQMMCARPPTPSPPCPAPPRPCSCSSACAGVAGAAVLSAARAARSCEECLPQYFQNKADRGLLPCPQCQVELREHDYSSRTPDELAVERALQIRRQIKKEYRPPPHPPPQRPALT